MRALAAILIALMLAGCTASGTTLLGNSRQTTATTAPPSDAVTAPAPVAAPEAAAEAAAETAAEAAPPDAAAAVAPKPSLLDRLRQRNQSKAKATPGAHDQIPDPIPVENPLARPPWEVFVEAGPNARNELDLETLYGPGNIPPELMEQDQLAQQQAIADGELTPPPVDAPVEAPKAEEPPKKKAKPGAVAIKAVAVPPVKGAKGSGNSELTVAMRDALQQAGWPILTAARADALTVQGRVTIGEAHGATQGVQIVWDVLTPDGKNLGNLKQDNAVPAGSLDASWGESARYAAEAAAEGIFSLIQKYR